MTLPLPGAALSLDMLALNRDWVLADARDVELQSFALAQVLDGDMGPLIDRARGLLDGHAGRRGLHGPFMGFAIDCPDPDIVAVIRRRMLACLSACARLGADQMVIHSPLTAWDHAGQQAEPARAVIQVERVRHVLAPVIARAEDQGVTLVIENVEDIDPAHRVRLAAALDSPAVAVSLDTGHALFAQRMWGAPAPQDFVAAAGARLAHVHLQDGDGLADRHWHPGQGVIDWPAVLAALAALPGPAPRLILEVNDQRHVARGAAHLAFLGLTG